MSLLFLLLGCGSEEVKTEVTLPQAFITWPTAEDVLEQGQTIRLVGYVQDPVYSSQPNSLRTLWKVGDTEYCIWEDVDAGGNTVCELSVDTFGDVPITLQVLNPDEQLGETSQTVYIRENNASLIEILSPVPTQNYYSNIPVLLSASVTDPEGGAPDLSGSWQSSLDGVLDVSTEQNSDGIFSDSTLLNAGSHTLTFTATEDGVRSSSEAVDIVVGGPNHPPDCLISSETHELIVADGQTAELRGTVFDQDIPLEELNVTITSSIDGVWSDIEIAEDGTFVALYDSPSVGIHDLLLSVQDEVGTECTTAAELIVGYGPTVEITGPTEFEWFNQGESVIFQGLVSDPTDAPEDLTIRWNSNYDGIFSENNALPNGVALAYAENLTAGQHIISLWAIDTDGFAVMDDIVVNINELPDAPTISLINTPTTSSTDLAVSIDIDSVDGENDPIVYEYSWLQNGAVTTFIGDTVPYAETTRGEVWEVIVTPFDGLGYGASTSIQTTIENSIPLLSSIAITPTQAYEDSTFTCALGSTYDEDNDVVSTPIEWFINGSFFGTGPSMDGANFNKGDTISCQSTPFDGMESGITTSSTTITVQNTAPVLASSALSSTDIYEDTTVTCTHPNATDIDPVDTNLTYSYEWIINSAPMGLNQASITGTSFDKGDTIQCSVTPFDGTDNGNTVVSSIAAVANTQPTLQSATLSPAQAFENSTLQCTGDVPEDIDGDAVSISYTWFINNQPSSVVANAIDGNHFEVGDTVYCEATPFDGTVSGNTETSNVVVILNTPPTLSTPSISPTTGIQSNEVLTCSATASDIDDGNLTSNIDYTWTASNGSSSTGATWTLNNQVISPNDSITCTASITDSDGDTVSLTSSSVSIVNTSPAVDFVNVNQSTVQTTQSVTCSASITDLDDGALSVVYTWLNGATPIGFNPTYTVDAQNTDVGDSIFCQAQGIDAQGDVVSGNSSSVSISNTAPVVNTVTISSSNGAVNDSTLSCSAQTSDIDQESLNTAYTWYNGQSLLGTGSSIDLGQHAITPQDSIRCVATTTDPHQSSASAESSVTIDNRAPVHSAVSISNTQPSTTDTVSCSATISDPDGDSTSSTYTWKMNGSTIGTGNSIALTPSSAVVNGTLTCEVATSDGLDSTTDTASVTIQNTAPTVNTPSISPGSGVVTGTTLTCSATGSDQDEGNLTPTYQWFRNGVEVSTGATYTLSASNSNVGQSFYCSATVVDSNGVSASANSSSVSVSNTTPSVNSVSISPSSSVYNSSSLTCSASVSDPDESVSPSYSWKVNGSTVASGSSINLSSHSVNPTDSISCTVSVSDSNGGSDTGSTSVTVANRTPSIVTPTLSNTTPDQTDTISCSSSASDPDGESLSISYTWTINGSTVGSGATLTLNASIAPIGATIVCTASTTDSYGASVSASTSGSVANNPPSVSTPSISPGSGVVTGTTLTCSASGSDPEDGSLSPTYRWFRNGSQVGTGSSYTLTASNSNVGQSFYCSATVVDSIGVSASANSSSISVSNTAPSVNSISISPSSSVYNSSSLTCSASVSDPDESVSPSYSWKINGSTVASGSSINLSSHSVNPTDSVSCIASVSDSNGGSDTGSTSVTVTNRSPSISTPALSNSTPSPTSTVSCSASASDPDGESLSISYSWRINGSVVGSNSSISLTPGIAPSGGTLTCIVSTTDGYGASVSASASATITNNAPSVSTPSISPGSGVVTGTTLTCSATGSDPEDGSLSPTYRWFRNGSQVGTGSSYTLTASNSNVGQSFYCSATVVDSIGASASANSSSVSVSNTLPSVNFVSISPSSTIYNSSSLTCSASVSDPDESVSPSYSWKVNGSTVTSGSSINLMSHSVSPTDTVACTVVVSDSNGGSDTGSTSITVANRAPTASGVFLSPSNPNEYDIVVCFPSGLDPDGDTLTANYIWTVNGQVYSDYQAIVLDPAFSLGGSTLTCIASYEDPYGAVSNTVSISTTIQSFGGGNQINNLSTHPLIGPTPPSLSIYPQDPTTADDVHCSGYNSVDSNGNDVTYQTVWVNGSETITSEVLYSHWTNEEDIWTCSVHVFDENGNSNQHSESVLILP